MDKNITLEESKKRFQQILEFTYHGRNARGVMGEADNEPQVQEPEEAPVPQEAQVNPNDGTQTMDNAQQQTPPGFNPEETQEVEDGDITPEDFNTHSVSPDDNVVDVTELTDAQEETKDEIEQFDEKFQKVFQVLNQWEELIKSNNEKIEDLKAEFEKRNPTQIEKLSMQTAKSEPFNVKPEEYWEEKEKTSNYSTEDDDNGKEQCQYVITKNDIDGTTDWKGISDSINDDSIYHPTLKNTMGGW